MPVIAIINRKGGSGKSTLATQLAGHLARQGHRVMLGDVDRQQSALAWLKRRASQPQARGAEIVGWVLDATSARRTPKGISHAVLDTPGGLQGLELARVVMQADAIIVPVSYNAFDRESAADMLREIVRLPKVQAGRCAVSVIGMRMDGRGRSVSQLRQWAEELGVSCLGALRESRIYPRLAETGLTLFDPLPVRTSTDVDQWQPLLQWLAAQGLATTAGVVEAARPLDMEAPEMPETMQIIPASLRVAGGAPLMLASSSSSADGAAVASSVMASASMAPSAGLSATAMRPDSRMASRPVNTSVHALRLVGGSAVARGPSAAAVSAAEAMTDRIIRAARSKPVLLSTQPVQEPRAAILKPAVTKETVTSASASGRPEACLSASTGGASREPSGLSRSLGRWFSALRAAV